MSNYVNFVKNFPLLSAAIQFAILAPLGEIIAFYIRGKKGFPFSLIVLIEKMISWSILAVAIKYAFVGFSAFPQALVDHGLLPELFRSGVANAFAKSTFTNVLFGPLLVFLHRYFDNLIEKRKNWDNIKGALWTLVWFWIPAHTVTFSLPVHFQMGLAALWSVVLGIILGYFQIRNKRS